MSRTRVYGALAALLALPLISGLPIAANAADMAVIHKEAVANVDPDTAWSRVGGFCDISQWLPPIKACEIVAGDGASAGTVRKLNFNDEQTLIEPMTANGPMSYTYGMTEGFLAGTLYTGTVRISAGPTDGTSTITWSAVLNRAAYPSMEEADNMVATLDGVYQAGVDGLKALAEGM